MTHRPSRMHCVLDWLGRIAAVLAVAVFSIYLYSSFFAEARLSYKGVPFPVLDIVAAGDRVPVSVIRCVSGAKPLVYRNTRELVHLESGVAFPQSDVEVSAQPGCHRIVSQYTQIPKEAPPGTYYVHGLSLVPGIMGSTHKVYWETDRFIVVDGK